MGEKRGNQPAFPSQADAGHDGYSKREHAALEILCALCSNNHFNPTSTSMNDMIDMAHDGAEGLMARLDVR